MRWRAVLGHVLQPHTHDPKLIPLLAQENAWTSRYIACLKKNNNEQHFKLTETCKSVTSF